MRQMVRQVHEITLEFCDHCMAFMGDLYHEHVHLCRVFGYMEALVRASLYLAKLFEASRIGASGSSIHDFQRIYILFEWCQLLQDLSKLATLDSDRCCVDSGRI